MKRLLTALFLALSVLAAEAREVFPLNEGWRFFFKSENTSDNSRHVNLPHSWNRNLSGEGYIIETTGNYQNNMYIPGEWASKRIFVKFYGVQRVANVFVNGSFVGSHEGAGTAFTFEITDKIKFGSDNALLVVVNNAFREDVLPTSSDMNSYGGIYRPAELIVTEKNIISPLYLGSEGILVHTSKAEPHEAEGEIEVHLSSKEEGYSLLHLEILNPMGEKVFERRQKVKNESRMTRIPFSVQDPLLWSPRTPHLYSVHAHLSSDTSTDEVSVKTGFRDIGIVDTCSLTINTERVNVHGVTLFHDNSLSGGTLSPKDYDTDLALIRSLGANAIRSAVMPHAQYLYDRCDEAGMLVWIDSPLQRSSFLSDIPYFPTEAFENNGLLQLREIIAQNINHPSVVMWGIFSRLWMRGDDPTPYIRRLNQEAKLFDPSRPTVASSDQNGELNFITDLIVWRQDVGWFRGSTDDVLLWRDQLQKSWGHLYSGVEYGGSGMIGHKSYFAQEEPRQNWFPEEKQSRFHEEYAKHLDCDSLFWGTWIDNMFDYGSARRPYGISSRGLVTLNRREKKDAFYLYKALWNDTERTLHIADKHKQMRDNSEQWFRVYSSAGMPTLLVGSDTVKMTEYARCQYHSDTLSVQGRVVVKAYAGDLCDSTTILVGNVLRAKRFQVPQRTAGPQKTN